MRKTTIGVLSGMLFLALTSTLLFLTGCGGDDGSSIPSSDSTPTTNTGNNQAILGPLSNAEVFAYRLTNLTDPIEGPISTSNNVEDLEVAGTFALELSGIPDDEWVLVVATGGSDIDADDDGVIDSVATPNIGSLHALAKASQWRTGQNKISLITEAAWWFSKDILNDSNALEERLNFLSSRAFLRPSNEQLDYDDVLNFNPRVHADNLLFLYGPMLPDQDVNSDTLAECIHNGRNNQDIGDILKDFFGESPWSSLEYTGLKSQCPACGFGFYFNNGGSTEAQRLKCPACGYEYDSIYSLVGLESIYFGYGHFVLSQEAMDMLEWNASFLQRNPTLIVAIAGHSDDYDTQEENLRLGESRALAAKNYLVSLGISNDRLRIISYGESMATPMAYRSSENNSVRVIFNEGGGGQL